MKKLIAVAFTLFVFSIVSKSQTDTIVTIKSETIICKITKLTSMNIFYTEKGIGKTMSLNEVKHHSPLNDYSTVSAAQKRIPTPTAGDELIKAKQHMYRGMVAGLAGTAISFMGISSSESGAISPMVYVGSAVSVVGIIMAIESFSHIGKAGQLMNEKKGLTLSPTNNGLSLCFKF